jgi:RNA polymerase sigma factor (sigma-70 family)
MRADEATLSRLAELSQGGDKIAYRQLLEACSTWLRRFFDRRIASCDVDDLVQETLISVHRNLATYNVGRPFLPWIAAIARYRWVDRLRKVYKNNEQMLVESDSKTETDDAIIAQLSIEALLKLIPSTQASAIHLTKIEGLSVAEASKILSQSEVSIKVNVHRGLKKLASLVGSI